MTLGDIFVATSAFSHDRLMDQILTLASGNSIFIRLCLFPITSTTDSLLPPPPFLISTSRRTAPYSLTASLFMTDSVRMCPDYIGPRPEFPSFWPSGNWSQKFSLIYLFTLFYLYLGKEGSCFEVRIFRIYCWLWNTRDFRLMYNT